MCVLDGVRVVLADAELVAVALAEAVVVAVEETVDVSDALGVADTLALDVCELVAMEDRVDVTEASEVGLVDSDRDTVAEGVVDRVGASGRTAMLSTRNEELPPVKPPPLTTENCSTTDAAGGSRELPRSQPERPKKPTSATLMLNSTVGAPTTPELDVGMATTCATSSRKSRATKKQSHATSISAGTGPGRRSSESVVGMPAAPAVRDTMKLLPLGVTNVSRPPGSACAERVTMPTRSAGAARNGATLPGGPTSNEYVVTSYGERVAVADPVEVPLAVGVIEGVAVPDAVVVWLLEPEPVCDAVGLLLGVPELLGVCEGDAVPVRLPLGVLLGLLVPDGVTVELGVGGTMQARRFLTCRRLASTSSKKAIAENVTTRRPLLKGRRTL